MSRWIDAFALDRQQSAYIREFAINQSLYRTHVIIHDSLSKTEIYNLHNCIYFSCRKAYVPGISGAKALSVSFPVARRTWIVVMIGHVPANVAMSRHRVFTIRIEGRSFFTGVISCPTTKRAGLSLVGIRRIILRNIDIPA